MVSHVSPSLKIGSEYIPCRSKKRIVHAVCQQAVRLGLIPTRLDLGENVVENGRMYLGEGGAFEYREGQWISHYVWKSCMVVSGQVRVIVDALEYNAAVMVSNRVHVTCMTPSHTPFMTQTQLIDYVMSTTRFSSVCGFSMGSRFAVALRDGTGFRCVDRRCNGFFTTHTEWASHYGLVDFVARPLTSFRHVHGSVKVDKSLDPFIVPRPNKHFETGVLTDTHPKTRMYIRRAFQKMLDLRHDNGYCICTINCSCANKVWLPDSVYVSSFPPSETIGQLCSIAPML